ncbi:hypothetical protein XA3_08040 [Xylocopilactobacillus apicola]|uniref:Uncharacterized protein n=2 Tax=Xylocopilactobacillus apicola TaxID=2932184 RepID=A0AAU9D4C8_9LACO|nr:hypothetical protein XA3_08040 [Xylocopilactobacillus apicola]
MRGRLARIFNVNVLKEKQLLKYLKRAFQVMILILVGLVLKSESVSAFPNVSTDLTTLVSDKYKFNPIKFTDLDYPPKHKRNREFY